MKTCMIVFSNKTFVVNQSKFWATRSQFRNLLAGERTSILIGQKTVVGSGAIRSLLPQHYRAVTVTTHFVVFQLKTIVIRQESKSQFEQAALSLHFTKNSGAFFGRSGRGQLSLPQKQWPSKSYHRLAQVRKGFNKSNSAVKVVQFGASKTQKQFIPEKDNCLNLCKRKETSFDFSKSLRSS